MDLNSCRICLTNDVYKLSSLFSSHDGKSYADLVVFSCGIEIDPTDDSLPQKICTDCIYQIQTAAGIKQKCINSDLFLKEKLGRLQEDSRVEENEVELTTTGQSKEFTEVEFIEETFLSPVSHRNFAKPKKRQKILKTQKIRNKNKKPEEADYQCFICEEIFDLISVKDSHVKEFHKEAKVCKICNKRKQTATSLENHLRFHKFGYRFLCSSCGKSFRFKNLLENHLNVEHFNTVKFYCDACPYESKFKINLERHLKSVHMKLKNFKCDKCGDHEYSTQVGLNLHLYRIHNVKAPVTCPDCLQGFTFESELRVHKKHCTGSKIRTQKARPQDSPVDILENGFRCRICEKIYETRSKWSVHFHHKHKNSNICDICNKQMASSTSLFKHIQVQHNNIKKFQCDICLKTFGFKHSLESHKNTHSGEKPFGCNLCSFRSGDRSTISKHKKKMHS